MTALLEFRDVTRTFRSHSLLPRRRTTTPAVRALNLSVGTAEVLALVGESGAGKSTAGRLALGLETADAGQVLLDGIPLRGLPRRELRRLQRRTHLVLQDPYQALHPGMRVEEIVTEALVDEHISREARRRRGVEALEEVQLTPAVDFLTAWPHELSGGQRQRVAFARAVVGRPRLVVADEPVSMLDVSLQAGVLGLVEAMRTRHGASFLFITHDLAVARHVADRIAVMHGGRLLELGTAGQVIGNPQHPYTTALLRAAEEVVAPDEPPGPFPPGGQPCQEHGHCQATRPACVQDVLTHVAVEEGHSYALHASTRPRTTSRSNW